MIVRSGDYTSEARRAAHQVLLGRGFTEASIADTPIDPVCPRDERTLSARRPKDERSTAQILAAANRRRLLFRATATMAICAVPIGLIASISASENLKAFAQLLVYVHLAIHAIFWRTPARILLLRPFNATGQRVGLGRLITRHLGFLGHVYTLQDNVFQGNEGYLPGRGSWVSGVQRLRFSFNITVDVEDDLWVLQRGINQRFRRNLNWAASLNRVFAVAADPRYWRRTVQVLINACDVVIIDASEACSGVMWETSEIAHYELGSHTIILTSEAGGAIAHDAAKIIGVDERSAVFQYDRATGRVRDIDSFLTAVAQCVIG